MDKILKSINELKERPSWDEYFIMVATMLSKRSSCDRLHVGCVLVKDNRIVSTGYNGHLPGAPHDSVVVHNHEQMTIHAEENAIIDSAKRGVSVDGCVAYVTHMPCLKCTKMLLASGVKTIIFANIYKPDDIVLKVRKNVNAELFKFDNGTRYIVNEEFIKRESEKCNSNILVFDLDAGGEIV